MLWSNICQNEVNLRIESSRDLMTTINLRKHDLSQMCISILGIIDHPGQEFCLRKKCVRTSVREFECGINTDSTRRLCRVYPLSTCLFNCLSMHIDRKRQTQELASSTGYISASETRSFCLYVNRYQTLVFTSQRCTVHPTDISV
jgi:hypothetical protein